MPSAVKTFGGIQEKLHPREIPVNELDSHSLKMGRGEHSSCTLGFWTGGPAHPVPQTLNHPGFGVYHPGGVDSAESLSLPHYTISESYTYGYNSPNMKRKRREQDPDQVADDIIVVDEDESEITTTNSKATLKRSWVWNYFKESEDLSEAVCQVLTKDQKCASVIKKDRSGSTKKFHKHLLKIHKLVDPKSCKKVEKAQTNIAKWIKNAKLLPKVSTSYNILYFNRYNI